jgi:hypothetical protein
MRTGSDIWSLTIGVLFRVWTAQAIGLTTIEAYIAVSLCAQWQLDSVSRVETRTQKFTQHDREGAHRAATLS